MKKRYSSAKPYGEWLAQELVTLEQIVRSVPESGEHGMHLPGCQPWCAALLGWPCCNRRDIAAAAAHSSRVLAAG